MSPSSELQDDIARIAAQRGKPVSDYLDADGHIQARALSDALSTTRIAMLFAAATVKMSDFDRLPEASRDFIRAAPVHICAKKWGETLAMCGDNEHALIAAAQAFIDRNLDEFTKTAYGPTHPQARRA